MEAAERGPKQSSAPSTGTLFVSGQESWIRRFEAPEIAIPRTLFPRQQAHDGLEIARGLPEQQRAAVLIALIPRLPEEDVEKAIEIAAGLGDAELRGSVLFSLAPRRPEPLLRDVLGEMAKASEIERLTAYIDRLLPYSNEDQLRDLLKGLRSIPKAQDRTRVMQVLAPALSKPLLEQAINTTPLIGDRRERVSSMVALARSDLPVAVVHGMVSECESFCDARDRAGMLAILLHHVSEPLDREVRAKAISAVGQVDDLLGRASLLESIAPGSVEREAAAALKQIQHTLAEARSATPKQGAGSPLGNFLADVNYGPIAPLLNIFSPHMSAQQLQGVVNHVSSIEYPRPRAIALAVLARHVADVLKEQVQAKALAAAWASEQADELLSNWYVGSVCTPAEVISILDRGLSEATVREAHAKAVSIGSAFSRAATLLELARAWLRLPHTGDEEFSNLMEWLNEAWEATWSIDRAWDWADMAAQLIPLLSDSYRNKILTRMQNLKDGGSQAVIIAAFAPYTPDALWPDLLAFVGTMEPHEVNKRYLQGLGVDGKVRPEMIAASGGSGAQAKALAGLAPYLPEPLLPEALSVALRLDGERRQEVALEGLAQRIAKLTPANALPLFRRTFRVLAARHREEFFVGLRAMTPVVNLLGGVGGASEAIQAIQDCGRWWP